MRVKVEYRTAGRAAYDDFCAKYPDIQLGFEDWEQIIYTFNYLFRDYILETGERAKLPWGMGTFTISKKKIKKFKEFDGRTMVNLPIDWKRTKEMGKRIYNLNAHTDGHRCKWFWFPRESKFYQHDVWAFKPSRKSSRLLAEHLKKPRQLELYHKWQRR